MIWKHKRVMELTGGSFSGNLNTVARAVNKNAMVLREAAQKIEELSAEIEKLKQALKQMGE
jgi:TolA-binding protein